MAKIASLAQCDFPFLLSNRILALAGSQTKDPSLLLKQEMTCSKFLLTSMLGSLYPY